MPSYGMKQKPAGVKCECRLKPISGTRKMEPNNKAVKPTLKIDSPMYKGNAALEAQKQKI